MNLTAGEIYFIRETDVLTKTETRYVKIGLVKEKDDRTSDSRAAEHQTGNPRQLHVAKIVKTPAVSEVENIIHKLYAPSRISGEWFHFSPSKFKEAIKTAESLAKEIGSHLKEFQLVEKYSYKQSNTKTIKATPALIKVLEQYYRADLKIRRCSEITKIVKELLQSSIAKGEALGHLASYTKSSSRESVDWAGIAEKHPMLYKKYCSEEEFFSARFTIVKNNGKPLDLGKIDKSLYSLALEIESLVKRSANGRIPKEQMFDQYLRLLGLQARAGLDRDLARASIQAACKTAAGIDGICTWARTRETGEVFDQEAFAKAHPKIVLNFTTVVKGKPSFSLNTKHAYAF